MLSPMPRGYHGFYAAYGWIRSTRISLLANTQMREKCAKMLLDESLNEGQKVEFKKIITHCETRWNSMLMMARSIIHLEECLKSIRDTPVKRKGEKEVWVDSIPEDEDFTLMKKVVRILTVFETISTMMQSETKPTICHVVSQLDFQCQA